MSMKKIRLEIIGLSYSQTQSGAYALVLAEVEGNRRLPIIIGSPEAQSIAIELEKMTPTRPLTHDLFKSFAEAFTIEVKEVIIYNLVEGIFFAKLICVRGEDEVEIDSRTSDAIALATRFDCPIYTYEFILSSAGIILEETEMGESDSPEAAEAETVSSGSSRKKGDSFSDYSDDELKDMLKEAIESEAYERASKIRDELNGRKKSNS